MKRIIDPCYRKAQAEVKGEALCVTKNLDVEDGKPQLERRHLEERRLENPHGDGMRKPHVTQETGKDGHTRRREHLDHDNSEVDDLPMLSNLGVDQFQTGTQSLWGRISQTPSANQLPIILFNTCRRQFGIPVGSMTARTRGTCIAFEGPGAASGPWGAESVT